MDKEKLKEKIRVVLEEIQSEGYEITFAGMPPFLPEYDKPVKLQVVMPQFDSFFKAISLVNVHIFKHFTIDERGEIWRVEPCENVRDIACREEDIIINRIGYKPLNMPYRFLEMA